ncbi:hypothetical protein ACP70R_004388 [Stipagrostis hirtigluma subsp. patula]
MSMYPLPGSETSRRTNLLRDFCSSLQSTPPFNCLPWRNPEMSSLPKDCGLLTSMTQEQRETARNSVDIIGDPVSQKTSFCAATIGFKHRLNSLFGEKFSSKLQERICSLYDNHCMQIPTSYHRKSEVLLLNVIKLLIASYAPSNPIDLTSPVSSPYDDILEFLDEVDSSNFGDSVSDEIVPDFGDDLCERFLNNLDLNQSNSSFQGFSADDDYYFNKSDVNFPKEVHAQNFDDMEQLCSDLDQIQRQKKSSDRSPQIT